jgi:hypothetical protein
MNLLDKARRGREAAAAEAAQRPAQTAPPAVHSYDRNDKDDQRPRAAPPPRPCDAGTVTFFPFGKYRAVPLPKVPEGYLLWALRNVRRLYGDLRAAVYAELGAGAVAVPPHCRRPPGARHELYDGGRDPFPDEG